MRLTQKEREIIMFMRQLNSGQAGHTKAVKPFVLTNQQLSVLNSVRKAAYGIKPETFSKIATKFGYKRPGAIGGFFKGKNASLRKITLPLLGKMIFLTERGKHILENASTPPLPTKPTVKTALEKEPQVQESQTEELIKL